MAYDKNRNTEEKKNQEKARPLKKSLFERLSSAGNTRTLRTFSMVLAVIIVFGTTYGMILPAITVDQESAEEMPGIYFEEEYEPDTDYEEVYEDSFQEPDEEEVYEDDEWLVEEESSDEAYSDYDDAYEGEEYLDTEGDDAAVIEEQVDETWEFAESTAEVSNFTYQETALETTSPVQTDLLGDVTFRIEYDSAAMIPDGSMFSVSEVDQDAETEEEVEFKRQRLDHLENAADALITGLVSDWSWHEASFFDVELKDPEGNVRQPESQIYLTVRFTNPVYTDKVQFVQFVQNEEATGVDAETPEIMNPVDLGYTEDGGVYTGVFLVESFSTFGVLTGDSLSAISEQQSGQTEDTSALEAEVAEVMLPESETESAAEAVLTESETESAAEPVLEEAVEYPAQSFRGSTENVKVTVLAPEGAFPADTTMTVKDASDRVVNDITEAVSDGSTTVNKVHAVDVTFRDKNGSEIEPLVPVKVTITAEKKQKTEETLVVHVTDEGNVEQIEEAVVSERNGESKARLTMEPAQAESADKTDSEAEAIAELAAESVEGTEDHEVVADAFSVYAIVYTVDFHYEVDGKEFAFSIPGGGFVSLEHVVEMLGISEASSESDDESEEELTDADVSSGNNTTFTEAVKLNEAQVSEAAKKFVADVESVEFSDPQLVWVGKIDEAATVGEIKEAHGLECEYSAELTEDQIAKMNHSTVEAGDWALISVLPFTSEETLTVTMKNGEQFVVRVTDAQIKKTVIDAKGDTWEIAVTYGEDAQIPDGAELKAEEILPETEEYAEYYRKAADLVCTYEEEGNRHGYGRLFDISIWKGNEEIEPKSKVQVSIKLVNAPENSDELSVVHFGDNAPEVMQVEDVPDVEPASVSNQTEEKNKAELLFETDAFSVYAVISTNPSNGYGLGGQKFAIVNRNRNNISEAVLGRSQENNTALCAAGVTVSQNNGQYYVAGQEVTLWEFENVNYNVYYIKAPNGQYMNLGNETAYLSDTPQRITVTQSGSGLRLANGYYGLNAWNRDVLQGFRAGTYDDDASSFTLYGINELIQNQADKISLTDLVNLHNGETPIEDVVIYTRILNQNGDGYDYYAVAADGSLTQVYDIGDTIGWVSSEDAPEHLEWKLTVHTSEGEPNGYFDFQNMETEMYLIPTEDSGIKRDDPEDSWDLGVNMQGWNNGTYGSKIERWDTADREYVGYAFDAVNKKIVPTADDSKKLEFLFARVKEDPHPNQLHPVDTLDGKTKGITIKMYDFDGTSIYGNNHNRPRSVEMTNVMGVGSIGSTNVNGVGYANRGLVSQTLTDGFPVATETRQSLSQLFNDTHFKSDASNIFVRQTYDETGYFSYDSSQNYAYLDQDSDQFILYRELAAPVMEAKNWTPSGQKGNFFPFDSLQELADQNKVFTNGITVKYDGDLQEMSPDNPQYGQTLYKIDEGKNNNYKSYFFGMTMEADFYQGPDGKDERGNDIIYEFNGDDDMWLYIDDRLVLDIGGCHGAVSGTINFSTGDVWVNGSQNQVHTTLKKIFQDAGRLPDGSNWTAAGAQKWFKGNTFADYTKHSFKMFYMERGSYASNLKMSFNLLTIEEGSFVLEKKLPDDVQSEYGDQVFAYQIYTIQDGTPVLYTPPDGKYVADEKSGERVLPEGQTESSGYRPSYEIGGKTYQNVYFLKPGESIRIPTENNEVRYYVREIGIDMDIYEEVWANQRQLTIESEEEMHYARISEDTVKMRGRVTYTNVPKELYALRLEKHVDALRDPSDTFRFDVRLEDSRTGQLVPYNQGEYYIVKSENGNDQYYKYENRQLVPSNEPVAYKAGLNGSIDHIYPGYTILIKGLLPGTDFQVTENMSTGNYPDGYQYDGKVVANAGEPEVQGADGCILSRTQAQEQATESGSGASAEQQDALVRINNSSRTNFSFSKIWRDPLGNYIMEWPDDKSIKVTILQDGKAYASYTIHKTDLTAGTKIAADEDAGGTGIGTGSGSSSGNEQKPQLEVSRVETSGYVFSLTGLPYGIQSGGTTNVYTYTVAEETVDGYQSPRYFEADGDEAMGAVSIGDGGTIKNDQIGVALPSTGGPGTGFFTLFGWALMAGAGLFLMRRRRV